MKKRDKKNENNANDENESLTNWDFSNEDLNNTNSDKMSTNSDKLNTNNDKLNVNSDILNTNSDILNTNSDILNTNSDILNTNSDILNTNSDILNTNNDKLNTNNDKLNTNTVEKCFESLNHTIDNVNIHVNNILKDNEEKYLLAFNTYMYDVQKEIRVLKKILKEEKIKELKDEKTKKLQKELKWYINECLRLDNISQNLKKEAEKWKRNNSLMKSHMLFLEKKLSKAYDQIIEKGNAKKEEKNKLEYNNAERKKSEGKRKGERREEENREDKSSVRGDETYKELNLRIANLEKKLKRQVNINSSLQEKLTKHYIEKSKYEKLFIDCSKEIQKDIEKHKIKNEKENYIEQNFSPLINEPEFSYFTKEDKKKLLISFFSSNNFINYIRNNIFSKEKIPVDINKKNSYTNPMVKYKKNFDISPFIL